MLNTIVHLFSLNWNQLLILGSIVLLFAVQEQFLSKVREKKIMSTSIHKSIMTVGVVLIGLGIILIGDLRLAVERSKHQRELAVKDSKHQVEWMLKQAELKILKAEMADLKAHTP